jgi:type II secretory ATPase GspE/PulE/Tfp pilus assembly ATPase PilB-like protein
MEKITGEIKIEEGKTKRIQLSIKHIKDLKSEIQKNISEETTKILEIILGGGICLESSDIHLEPEENQVKMRVRIDGILHDVIYFKPKTYNLLLSRIKLLSGIKLNITDRAQDGRFTVLFGK